MRAQQRFRSERYALSEETEALVREIQAIGLEVGDVTADFTLGFCLLWRGKPEEAETYLERGRDVARARGVALVETRCLVYGLVAKRKRNDVEGARALLAELDELEELHGYAGLVSANAAWIVPGRGRRRRPSPRRGRARRLAIRRTNHGERLPVGCALSAPRDCSRTR